MNEKTLVLLKPDTVSKGLIGDVVSRFEKVGLKIVGMKMLKADDNIASNHYQITEEWAIPLFNKTKEGFENSGKEFSYSDPMEYGGSKENCGSYRAETSFTWDYSWRFYL
ncbi:hypothetical protein J4459_01580 [Candidatus Woesearchaeota archaeon]|nr:hypothetical protein [Candidatus Woesearchaeota archaeon]